MTRPYGHVSVDEQACLIAHAVDHLHRSDHERIMFGAPAWLALDALRGFRDWVTWWEWLDATTTALYLAVGRVLPGLAREAAGTVGVLAHRDAYGRAVALYDIEDRRDPRAPWRARARRFARVWHPPLRAGRWVWETGRVEQLTLAVAA